jgi:hypothetical protein
MYGVAWFAGAVLLDIASILFIAEVVCMRENAAAGSES